MGTPMPGGWIGTVNGWSQTSTGGHAQCCTSCTSTPGCVGWTYNRNSCTLYSEVTGYEFCANGQPDESSETCVSGTRGAFPTWTPLPANFKNNGFLSMGVGKYYHSGGHSAGGAPGDLAHPGGSGTPPLADRDMSWTAAGPNGTVQFPDHNLFIKKWGSIPFEFGNFQYVHPDDEGGCLAASGSADYCALAEFPPDGTPASPPKDGVMPFADFVTYNVAIGMMQFASENLNKTGQPFFLVTGIKRPVVLMTLFLFLVASRTLMGCAEAPSAFIRGRQQAASATLC